MSIVLTRLLVFIVLWPLLAGLSHDLLPDSPIGPPLQSVWAGSLLSSEALYLVYFFGMLPALAICGIDAGVSKRYRLLPKLLIVTLLGCLTSGILLGVPLGGIDFFAIFVWIGALPSFVCSLLAHVLTQFLAPAQ